MTILDKEYKLYLGSDIVKAYIDIENSKTQIVETICVNIIKYEENEMIFDISTLNNHELEILKNAINDKLTYTDIEMFFIDDSNIPNFGPDYEYEIIDNKLILKYIYKKKKEHTEEKNDDWTLKYENEFGKIAYDFLISKYNYLLIYNKNGLKYKYYKNKPKDSIFMDLFFNKNYKMIAIFKRKDKINLNSNLRDNLIYINSYCE